MVVGRARESSAHVAKNPGSLCEPTCEIHKVQGAEQILLKALVCVKIDKGTARVRRICITHKRVETWKPGFPLGRETERFGERVRRRGDSFSL